MAKIQQFRDVDIPDNFEDWDVNARVNYLANTMDRTQIADFLREICDLEEREEPTFKKDELTQIILTVQNDE